MKASNVFFKPQFISEVIMLVQIDHCQKKEENLPVILVL